MKKLLLFLMAVSAWGFAPCAGANGYTFCQTLVLDHTKVPSNQSNYPAVICFGVSMGSNCLANTKQLATAANGGFLEDSTNGFDFIITSDSGAMTPLNYETVFHTLTTGDAELWVLLPSISSTVDLTIYLFYGNASVTTDQSNPTAVWDSDYLAVHHFPATSGFYTTTIPDSTTANPLSVNTSPILFPTLAIPAVIGGGADLNNGGIGCGACGFTNEGPYTNFPPNASPAPFTMEGWFNTNGVNTSGSNAYCFGANITDGDRWSLGWDGPNLRWIVESRNRGIKFANELSGWHRIVSVLPSGQNSLLGSKVYIDGVSQTLTDIAGGNLATHPDYAAHGYNAGLGCGFGSPYGQYLGLMDELRLSKIERSQDWITTDYNNQSNVKTFWSNSTATNGGGAGKTIIIN